MSIKRRNFMRKKKLHILLVISLLFISCSGDLSVLSQQKPTVNLPDNIEKHEGIFNLSRPNHLIIEVRKDGEIYIGENKIEKQNLKSEFTKLLALIAAEPDEIRIRKDENDIYIKADIDTDFSNLVTVLKNFPLSSKLNFQIAVRKKEKEFSYYSEKHPSGLERLGAFEVNNFCDGWQVNAPKSDIPPKPNPLTLVVKIEKDNKLKLNLDFVNLEQLTVTLRDTFRNRAENYVYRGEGVEIEKSVFVLASPNLKFADVVPSLEALSKTEQYPTICIQFEDDILKRDVIKNNLEGK
jgi:biopolymer transport protein ExbD